MTTLKRDSLAGLTVFLIAVPLCLGIALASGAPLFSGLIAGAVGGLLVGTLSGSRLSVSGPAAGLTAIVLVAIQTLGSFERFLCAGLICGMIQLLLGRLRAGGIANAFPSQVIKGMLTGIGIVIISTQIPHFFGLDMAKSSAGAARPASGADPLALLAQVTPGAVVVGLLALAVTVWWERPTMKRWAFIPGPLVAVIAGTLLNELWVWINSSMALTGQLLVGIPVASTPGEFFAFFTAPDLSALTDSRAWMFGITMAVVASLETMLCIEAIDKLDPKGRVTPGNRELQAQGIGNLASSALGGLPVTSVIVRSAANLNAGAQTKLATVIHGALIVSCGALLPQWLNRIPLAVLAAILLVTGYKLAKISTIRDAIAKGWHYGLPFTATVVGVVTTDLLTGVAIGLGTSLIPILWLNLQASFALSVSEYFNGNQVTLRFGRYACFLTCARLKKALNAIPPGCTVCLDARLTVYIDEDVLATIQHFQTVVAPKRNIIVSTIGLKDAYGAPTRAFDIRKQNAVLRRLLRHRHTVVPAKGRPARALDVAPHPGVITYEDQRTMTPYQALARLDEGNQRFRSNKLVRRNLMQQLKATSTAQFPFAVVLSCIDSRTPAELIFDQGLGDIFSVRVAGNVINEDVLGSMEYACKVAGSKVVVVLGHTGCGAVKGALSNIAMGNITPLLDKLTPAVKLSDLYGPVCDRQVNTVAAKNVELVVAQVRAGSSILAEMEREGTIRIIGGMYDLHGGSVTWLDARAEGYPAAPQRRPMDLAPVAPGAAV